MPLQFSQAIPARWQIVDANFEIKSVDLHGRGEFASPIVIVDDFRVRSRPFPPHPHAGFSAVTYVMRDSPGSLRSRVSLGEDIVIGPGGIVWTEAGSGVLHQEIPADSRRELHGLQLFVNLSAKSKMTPPRMLQIEGADAPEWMDDRERAFMSLLAPTAVFPRRCGPLSRSISWISNYRARCPWNSRKAAMRSPMSSQAALVWLLGTTSAHWRPNKRLPSRAERDASTSRRSAPPTSSLCPGSNCTTPSSARVPSL